jgi:hypothetical protein
MPQIMLLEVLIKSTLKDTSGGRVGIFLASGF